MKLYLLPLGMLQPAKVPIVGYLVQTDDGQNILIDTGFPHRFIHHPPEAIGPLKLHVEMREEDYIVNRLAALGLKPEDIQTVIATHFDLDHAGSLDCFLDSEIVVQHSHYETAQSGHQRFVRSHEHWSNPKLKYRLLDGDSEIAPGVEIIESTGHVPGHQSVLIRLPKTGPVLLAIDAIPASSMLDPDTRVVMPNDESEADTRSSTRKLVDLAERENVQLIVHGHDSEQWPALKHAPEFYE